MSKIRKCSAVIVFYEQDDRMSGLPSEVVLMILSRLTLKEAVRTSVLSSSWKDLWKAYPGFFDFDAPNLIWHTDYDDDFKHLATCSYVVWVDKLLDSLQSQTIQGLRFVFDMNMEYSGAIDRWIDFAISKKVESLVLDLSPLCHMPRNSHDTFYAFLAWLLYAPIGGFHAFDRLTSLELRFVSVPESVTQYIFGNCRLLQRLCLEEIPDMKNLRLDNSLPDLKHLEITMCRDLVNVYVSARRLTSFKYRSDMIDQTKMVFGEVPQLSRLVLGGDHYRVLLDSLPFNLSHLDSVSLIHDAPVCFCNTLRSMGCLSFWGSCNTTLPRFQELKQLELNIAGCLGDSILFSTTFLDTATCLEKLVLTLTWRYLGNAHPRVSKMSHVLTRCKIKSLKEVVYVGWLGLDAEVEIVKLLIESARSTLERITINLCHSHNDKDAIKLETRWEKDNAKVRAMQLQQKLVSSNIKLLVN